MSESKVQPSCKRDCREVTVNECGIAVKRLPEYLELGQERTLSSIADMAKLTGSPDIFSGDDVLAELLYSKKVDQNVLDETQYIGSSIFYRELNREIARARSDIKRLGVQGSLETFPEAQRVALKNQAARFMEDAKALVQSSKK